MLLDGRLSRVEGFELLVGAVVYLFVAYSAARRGESFVVVASSMDALVEGRRQVWLDSSMLEPVLSRSWR